VSAQRVWISLPNWLGDALMARPLLHAIRRSSPGAPVLATGPAPLLALLEAEALFDETEPWPADRASRDRAVERVRAWRPDAAIVLPPSFSSAFAAWRSGARRRVGFAGQWRSLLLSTAIARPPRGEQHLSREYAALGEALGARAIDPPSLPVPPRARAEALALRESAGARGAAYAVIAPGAIYGPAKRWDAGRFAELARRLMARGLDVFVCGGEAEREVGARVLSALGGARDGGHGVAIDAIGRTSLGALSALCAGAAIAVSNDSGLAHLAGAVGAPTVVIFGSTSSGWTAPLGARVRVVQRATPCAPCFRRTCAIGYRCLERIEVDRVEAACADVLAERSAA
jgi:heptosyltransferase-2